MSATWTFAGTAPSPAFHPTLSMAGIWIERTLTNLIGCRPDLSQLPSEVASLAMASTQLSITWICGAVGFALALYLLLSWRTETQVTQGTDDAQV
jgi:hypothetical protein